MEIYKLPAITVSIPGRLEVMELSINLLTSLSNSKARWRTRMRVSWNGTPPREQLIYGMDLRWRIWRKLRSSLERRRGQTAVRITPARTCRRTIACPSLIDTCTRFPTTFCPASTLPHSVRAASISCSISGLGSGTRA